MSIMVFVNRGVKVEKNPLPGGVLNTGSIPLDLASYHYTMAVPP